MENTNRMNTTNIKENLKSIWKISEGYRTPVLISAILDLLHVMASIGFIVLCKNLMDAATGVSTISIPKYAVLLIACMVTQLLLGRCSSKLEEMTEVALVNRLRHQLFCHLLKMRCDVGKPLHTGDVVSRMEEDVIVVADGICSAVPDTISSVFRMVGATIFLMIMDVRLGLIILLIMPVVLGVAKGFIKRMRTITQQLRATESKQNAFLQEHIRHRILIRTLEYEPEAANRLGEIQQNLYGQYARRVNFSLRSTILVQMGFAAGYVTAFLWGVYGIRHGMVTFGMMTAFLQLVSHIQRPALELGRLFSSSVKTLVAAERLNELYTIEKEEQQGTYQFKQVPGIRLEHVRFAYPDGKRCLLDDFSYIFEPGTLTAVVGETGAGKTTLLKLLLALYKPNSGKIWMYGDGKEMEVTAAVRGNLSYVPQGNTLLSGTIRENLYMGNPMATQEEMDEALFLAAADFVYRLPEGLDTPCAENGVGLSEGQAQRIAIARGLLRPGKVLLLDEPTSALDEQTSALLLDRLAEKRCKHTVILITHKENVAQRCEGLIRIAND